MTNDQKLAKLDETEQKAWEGNWMQWSPSGWEQGIDQSLSIIEHCQNIRANLTKVTTWCSCGIKTDPHLLGSIACENRMPV